MRVQLLSPYPDEIAGSIIAAGDEIVSANADFIVSYGHREIIREPTLSCYSGRIINIHIAMLPWNRGSDPNFWSWHDGTPKGVTIHQIDAGLDTGQILIQRDALFSDDETLATSYAKLRQTARSLFADAWSLIRADALAPRSQVGRGSYHRAAECAALMKELPLRYDTPVSVISSMRLSAELVTATKRQSS